VVAPDRSSSTRFDFETTMWLARGSGRCTKPARAGATETAKNPAVSASALRRVHRFPATASSSGSGCTSSAMSHAILSSICLLVVV
jgi:hypothetical protein